MLQMTPPSVRRQNCDEIMAAFKRTSHDHEFFKMFISSVIEGYVDLQLSEVYRSFDFHWLDVVVDEASLVYNLTLQEQYMQQVSSVNEVACSNFFRSLYSRTNSCA